MTQSSTPVDLLIEALVDSTDNITEAAELCLSWAEFFFPMYAATNTIASGLANVLAKRDDLLAAVLQDKTVAHITNPT